jgi:hypothetical protein
MKILVEVAVGSQDAQTEVGDTDRPDPNNEAFGYYFLTDQGTVGKRFWVATPYALGQMAAVGKEADGHAEKYEIIERLDADETGEVLVRCKFIGYAQ